MTAERRRGNDHGIGERQGGPKPFAIDRRMQQRTGTAEGYTIKGEITYVHSLTIGLGATAAKA